LGVEIVSVSTDSKFVHKMWNDKELSMMVDGGIPFPMATDVEGKVGAEYGAYSEAKGIELRGTFLIDPDGVVQSVVIQAESLGRNVDETIRQIQAAQHVRASENKEATPVGWTPEKITLTPSAELVGKVCDKWNV
jgi:alkyl hydroperoxide reductase subunit AhpC